MIISDENLLKHRIALQGMLTRKTLRFGDYVDFLKLSFSKIGKTGDLEKEKLRVLVQSIAINYFELQYGNFFYKQSIQFRNAVIDEATKKCLELIEDGKESDAGNYVLGGVYIFLETALEAQLKLSGQYTPNPTSSSS